MFAQQVTSNLRAYGFDSLLPTGAPGSKSLFLADNIHLSTDGFVVMALYMENVVTAPGYFAAPAEAAQVTTTGFGRSVLSHLEGERASDGGSSAGPISVYGGIVGATGSRSSSLDALGFDYDAGGARVGIEYRGGNGLKLGAVAAYSNGEFDYRQGRRAKIDLDAYQVGGYASFSHARGFLDLVGLYGQSDLKAARPGIISTVEGDTRADSYSVGARGGLLFDLAPGLQAGPLAGVTYVHSTVDAYTEQGDLALSYRVEEQEIESLVGSLGVQFRFPMTVNAQAVSPYVNLTAERDFNGDDRTILASLTQSPLISIPTSVAGRGDQTYGAVQAGISTVLGDRTWIDINVASTLARDTGNDFNGHVSVRYRF